MHLLIVDDDDDSRKYLCRFLARIGHEVTEASCAAGAMEVLQAGYNIGLIISDLNMPDRSGLELLKDIKRLYPEKEVIVYTGAGDIHSARQTLKNGAYDYILKPLDLEELSLMVERVAALNLIRAEHRDLKYNMDERIDEATKSARQELEEMRSRLAAMMDIDSLVFISPSMQKILEQTRIYHSDPGVPVLIEGETGVGKEIIARLIHYGTESFKEPFIDINCTAISPNLFESELFGYESGSFTGAATGGRKGKLDMAVGGTLFLDEIGDMSLDMQVKLLRVLEERQFYRVGGLNKIKLESRLIFATNANLPERVAEGRFRPDLYYRLGIGRISIPPLRDRAEDIIPLAVTFMKQFSRRRGKSFQSISPEARFLLENYSWPGNVRELRNVMELATLMHDDTVIYPEYLRLGAQASPSSAGPSQGGAENAGAIQNKSGAWNISLPGEPFSLDELMDQVVMEAVKINHGNKTATAKYLNISRRVLCYRLEQMKSRYNGSSEM